MPCWRALAVWAFVVVLTGACAAVDDDTSTGRTSSSEALRIASFDFAESRLLAELYAQGAELAGVPVVRVGAIGPREITAPALELDHVDLVPEYLGSASRFFGVTEVARDPPTARRDLADRLEERGLTALGVSEAEDVNAFAVSRKAAEELELRSVSDLAPFAATMRFGGPPECVERELCLRGLEATYGLVFAEFVAQPTLAFTVESLRRDEIDVGLLFSTAGELEGTDLVLLDDDRGLQPPENIVPVVRIEALDRWGPELAATVDAISEVLTTRELRALNRRMADGEDVATMVAAYLLPRVGPERDAASPP